MNRHRCPYCRCGKATTRDDLVAAMVEKMARAFARITGQQVDEAPDFEDWHWEEFTDGIEAALTAASSLLREAGLDVPWDMGSRGSATDGGD